ncbi:TPA: threonine/serine exporter family protein [Enterococcus faecium]|uniref:threonine/serine exporter family protein n=1 Tax=Enterococcus lactis TaxID=357441 RepID=UPI001B3885F5|nr:threonine/serine exporter family protein [Enterococcus lactis]EME8151165.1 threonine/serine exporter family protein [Enterococcus faecium]MBQ0861693.1 threonine/serine exporter family protein [Enterococcus lactis]HAQ4449657.1 threonine/serine exporter family protein [Enterococcus faecium]
MTGKELDLLLDTCLLAGKIMMESNAEMYRVEDTMSRIALASGNFRLVSYVTQTGLFIGLDRTSTIRMEQITNRSINLEKVVKVNDLSRKYVASELTLEELYSELQAIDRDRSFFPVWLQIVSAAVISGTIMVLFGGKMTDLSVTLVIGGWGNAVYLYSLKFFRIKFLSEFLSSLLIGIAAIYSVRFGLGSNQDLIIIGCVMPLVPGVQITNAIRDLLAGHYVSGVSRGTEAMMTATMIGFAIAFIFQLFY